MLISQKMRRLSPELDPLRLGTGWKPEDLEKPQIFIESTFGDSHPGSGHLDKLTEAAREGIAQAGGYGARYFCTDMCDGESQGTDGINYSLASREMIAGMIEIQANATPFDAGVFIASCDKGLPGNLMGLARVNIPSVVVTGGTMAAGPELLTLEQLGAYSARFERGEITEERLNWAKQNACPSCGACSFIGTASTMQIMAEALGLTLPGSALLPATSPDLLDYAREAGKLAVKLAFMENMRPSDIVTLESFENAIRLFVKRNFSRDGKNQAEKPRGRLKAVFGGRQYKTLTPPRAGAWSGPGSPYSCGFGGCAASLNAHARRLRTCPYPVLWERPGARGQSHRKTYRQPPHQCRRFCR